jgi:hypothetical protein
MLMKVPHIADIRVDSLYLKILAFVENAIRRPSQTTLISCLPLEQVIVNGMIL